VLVLLLAVSELFPIAALLGMELLTGSAW
jgi:hypothetical protein